MNELLNEPISVLCEEVGIPVPTPDDRGDYHIVIEDRELRVQTLNQGKVVMVGVIGNAESIASSRDESLSAFLGNCLSLAAVRFVKLGTRQVLSVEPESGELVLWVPIDGSGLSIPTFLATAESLLNELEFWKNWLSAS